MAIAKQDIRHLRDCTIQELSEGDTVTLPSGKTLSTPDALALKYVSKRGTKRTNQRLVISHIQRQAWHNKVLSATGLTGGVLIGLGLWVYALSTLIAQ